MRHIQQNLFFAFIYNVLGIPPVARVLYPFIGLLLNPMIADAAMAWQPRLPEPAGEELDHVHAQHRALEHGRAAPPAIMPASASG